MSCELHRDLNLSGDMYCHLIHTYQTTMMGNFLVSDQSSVGAVLLDYYVWAFLGPFCKEKPSHIFTN